MAPSIGGKIKSLSRKSLRVDEVDALPSQLYYDACDVTLVIISIVSYVADIGTDCFLAYYFYVNRWIPYFIATLVFVIVPSIVISIISFKWYLSDSHDENLPPVSTTRWIWRSVCLILQLGPLLRYLDSLIYGVNSRNIKDKDHQRRRYRLAAYEDADATLLRLFECFLESLPQLLLQLYILVHDRHVHSDFKVGLQVTSLISSLGSSSWALTSFHRSLRHVEDTKTNISWTGTVVQFFWYICLLSSRVLALVLFASVFELWIFLVVGIHWILMYIWLICMNTTFCQKRYEEVVFSGILAFVFVFTYLNVIDEPTRYKYTFFYTLCLLENTVLIVLWFLWVDSTLWYYHWGIVMVFVLFVAALILMMTYYSFLHPSVRMGRPRPGKEIIHSVNNGDISRTCIQNESQNSFNDSALERSDFPLTDVSVNNRSEASGGLMSDSLLDQSSTILNESDMPLSNDSFNESSKLEIPYADSLPEADQEVMRALDESNDSLADTTTQSNDRSGASVTFSTPKKDSAKNSSRSE